MFREKKSFAIHTLGCRVNTYESDAIAQALREAGFSETSFSEPADVYIVNTCTVTNVADKKSRQMLHRAKKKNPEAIVVAVGCYVDAALKNPQMQAVLKDAAIDLLIPNRDKAQAAALILARLQEVSGEEKEEKEETEAAGEAADSAESEAAAASGTAALPGCGPAAAPSLFMTELDGHTRAFVKVQDGCNQFCSYCIIPYVRGRISSRPMEDCIREIRALAENGVREVVLTGIHLSSYGKDFSEKREAGAEEKPRVQSDDIETGADAPLLKLLKAVNDIEGISRIRMGSLEPRLMSEGFVSALAGLEKVCPHFHLSLQSGSKTTLERMNRRYTPEEYRESCARIRRVFPDAAITTDVIVGFPGETEEEFEESRRFIEEIGFYELHVFKYSRRAGTRADKMEGQVDEAVKERRSRVLLALAERLSDEFRNRFVGREVQMLCEEEIEFQGERYATGYSREYVRCIKKCSPFIRNAVLCGTVLEICKEKPVYECLLLR